MFPVNEIDNSDSVGLFMLYRIGYPKATLGHSAGPASRLSMQPNAKVPTYHTTTPPGRRALRVTIGAESGAVV